MSAGVLVLDQAQLMMRCHIRRQYIIIMSVSLCVLMYVCTSARVFVSACASGFNFGYVNGVLHIIINSATYLKANVR